MKFRFYIRANRDVSLNHDSLVMPVIGSESYMNIFLIHSNYSRKNGDFRLFGIIDSDSAQTRDLMAGYNREDNPVTTANQELDMMKRKAEDIFVFKKAKLYITEPPLSHSALDRATTFRL